MLTFEEARAKAEAELRPKWEGPGTFYVAPWGSEDALRYVLVVGAYEGIVGNDPSYLDDTDTAWIVRKVSGDVERFTLSLDDLESLRPCGEPEPDLPEPPD